MTLLIVWYMLMIIIGILIGCMGFFDELFLYLQWFCLNNYQDENIIL